MYKLLKIVLSTFLFLFLFTNLCLSEDRNFSFKIEVGPDKLYFGKLPLTKLPLDHGEATGTLFSIWFSFGYRSKKFNIFSNFGFPGSNSKHKEGFDPFNSADIHLLSIMLSTRLFRVYRMNFFSNIGYQYTFFKAFPTDNFDVFYKFKDTDFSLGGRTEFKLRDAVKGDSIKNWDIIMLDISYEYTNVDHPLEKFKVSLRCSSSKDTGVTFNYAIYSQRDLYKMYVISIGVYTHFGFKNIAL